MDLVTDLFDLQTTLTVLVILTATAVVVFLSHLRRHHQPRLLHRVRTSNSARPQRPTRLFEATPVDYLAARKLAAARPLQPSVAPASPLHPLQLRAELPQEVLVPVVTPSRPPVEPRIEREKVTVEMAPPSPSAPSSSAEITLPPITIDAALWERLISSQPQRNLLSAADFAAEPIHQIPSAPRLANVVEATCQMIREDGPDLHPDNQPRGMIQKAALDRWLERELRFNGLVVSIGVNDGDSSMWHTPGLMQSIGNYIAGLLRAKDYYCRTGYDEFVIVCPGELGAQSQRRLNNISERLWDYQLRGVGACSVLFSWGGVQVIDHPLAGAVASATERMRETKRVGPATQSGHARRPAV